MARCRRPWPVATGDADGISAWWTFKRLQDAASHDWQRHTPLLRAAWSEFEEKVEAERARVEAAARAATQADDRDAAAVIVSDFMARTVEEALRQAERLRDQISG